MEQRADGHDEDRLESSAADLGRRLYGMLNCLVAPRPIAWVSTVDLDGRVNLAPHSYFTVASADPPVVQFTSVGRKDTLRNVEACGEFVVHVAPWRLRDAVNLTGIDAPPGVDELALALERACGSCDEVLLDVTRDGRRFTYAVYLATRTT